MQKKNRFKIILFSNLFVLFLIIYLIINNITIEKNNQTTFDFRKFDLYYHDLIKNCYLSEDFNCCIASTIAMSKRNSKIAINDSCNEGYYLNSLDCEYSYLWCERDHKPIFLIIIDGMRADSFKEANTPYIDSLINDYNSAYSFNSTTVCPSTTPSAHASLFTGLSPEEHNFHNANDNFNGITIFEVFEKNGYTTALIDGKGMKRIKGLERSVSYYYGDDYYYYEFIDGVRNIDSKVVNTFIEIFMEHKPDFSFILLPIVDYTGHTFGHDSQEYLNAINEADSALKLLIKKLKELNLFEESQIIILSDHGMTDNDHRHCFPTDMIIPIIKYGYNFPTGEIPDQSIKDIFHELVEIYELNY
ncbi:MAG: alkaline phosphatase family protein [Candidatus Woesearchaeota archaeon]